MVRRRGTLVLRYDQIMIHLPRPSAEGGTGNWNGVTRRVDPSPDKWCMPIYFNFATVDGAPCPDRGHSIYFQ